MSNTTFHILHKHYLHQKLPRVPVSSDPPRLATRKTIPWMVLCSGLYVREHSMSPHTPFCNNFIDMQLIVVHLMVVKFHGEVCMYLYFQQLVLKPF